MVRPAALPLALALLVLAAGIAVIHRCRVWVGKHHIVAKLPVHRVLRIVRQHGGIAAQHPVVACKSTYTPGLADRLLRHFGNCLFRLFGFILRPVIDRSISDGSKPSRSKPKIQIVQKVPLQLQFQ